MGIKNGSIYDRIVDQSENEKYRTVAKTIIDQLEAGEFKIRC